ncbi:hypothetical protein DFH09DRAFT_1325539 [Mycena vulgaris]|nr:hypothetical protein DFH09DRAFT_1325539 [Mycena vulgaris]
MPASRAPQSPNAGLKASILFLKPFNSLFKFLQVIPQGRQAISPPHPSLQALKHPRERNTLRTPDYCVFNPSSSVLAFPPSAKIVDSAIAAAQPPRKGSKPTAAINVDDLEPSGACKIMDYHSV